MSIEIKTLIICDALVTFVISLVLLLYRSRQKTYNGFGLWILGSFAMTFAYASLLLRPWTNLGLSIILVNGGFILSGAFRIDGVFTFLHGKRINKFYYLIPFVTIIGCSIYYYVSDNILARNFILSIAIFIITLKIGYEFFRHANQEKPFIYRLFGILHIIFGLQLMTRALLWIITPTLGLFESGFAHIFYFLSATIFEIFWGFSLLIMNSSRLEQELLTSQKKLQHTLQELEKTMSELNVLGGMLPICSSCKKIRDDKGYWNAIENYIRDHSEAEFNHSICPDCANNLYPDFT